MGAIIKKELKKYFLSPIGYIFIGIFLLVSGIVFYANVFTYMSIDLSILYEILAILVLTIMVPILTMGTFSEERKNGTEEILLTSPISVFKIVLGKFISCSIVAIIAILCTLIFYVILSYFGSVNFLGTFVVILGFTLLALSYISFGILMSSLTENQIIAAILSLLFFLLQWILPSILSFLGNYSLIYSFLDSFYQETITLKSVILMVSFIVLCLSLTDINIKRRKFVK